MKVLVVIETLGRGGAERVLANTLPVLIRMGVSCEVAVLFHAGQHLGEDEVVDELESKGVKVHRLHLSYKWNVIEGVYKLNRLIKKSNFNIIHAHIFFACFYTGLSRLLNPGIKTIVTFHSLTFCVYPPNSLLKKIRIIIEKLLTNWFIDHYNACSQAVADHYKSFLSLPSVNVIYNGFPLSDVRDYQNDDSSVLLRYFDVVTPDFIVVTPGRAHIHKGHHYLLEAITLLDMDKFNIGFIFIGDGPEYDNITSEIHEKNLEERVKQLHSVHQKELFKIISSSDIVVLPSVSEGFPMVVGEAMSLGKPIISTQVSGVPELIDNKKEGLLVPAEDPVKLAESIVTLINDPELRAMLATNAKNKIKQFDIKVIANQWKEYYERILN